MFESNRGGDTDIYVYKIGQGILTLPGLNSPGVDADPSISGDGSQIAFQSDRGGDFDIYVYDLNARAFIEVPGLNTGYDERGPDLSADGTRVAFRSERPDESVDGSSDIFIYDMNQKSYVPLRGGWLNTRGGEYLPSLNADGTLLSFTGLERADGISNLADVYLYDLRFHCQVGRIF